MIKLEAAYEPACTDDVRDVLPAVYRVQPLELAIGGDYHDGCVFQGACDCEIQCLG